MKLKRKYVYLTTSILIIILLFIFKTSILYMMGTFLLVEMEPEKADVIVIMRGDRNYSRVLEVRRLFKRNYADNIFISTALLDNYSRRLKKYGVDIPTEQQRLFSILVQLGISEEKIVVDTQPSGGGTTGELCRVREMMERQGYKKAIIVTSWYHTRRTYLICKRTFKNDNLKFFVVAAKDDISSPSNWWRYRYEARNVFEEFPKLATFYLEPIFKLSFADDPGLNKCRMKDG